MIGSIILDSLLVGLLASSLIVASLILTITNKRRHVQAQVACASGLLLLIGHAVLA